MAILITFSKYMTLLQESYQNHQQYFNFTFPIFWLFTISTLSRFYPHLMLFFHKGRFQQKTLSSKTMIIQNNMHEEEQCSTSYRCSQLFGYRSRSQKNIEEDNISALRFDPSGEMLALGDRAGRLIVFNSAGETVEDQQYDYHFEFQSHQREFDTLRSLGIGEEITHINWLRPQSKYLKLLTSNGNTIKLWKVFERQPKYVVKSSGCELAMPHLQSQQPYVSVNLRQLFPNRACRSLNSFNLSRNEEYLFATDDANAYLWSIQNATHPFIIKQLSKNDNNNKEGKYEKITCAQLHPHSQSLFAYGTNKGLLGFNDSRTSITHSNTMTFYSDNKETNFLSEIINKFCSVMFLQGTRSIVTRDLISVKVWDMCNNKQPIISMPLDQNIESHLCDLFEADALDDKFGLSNANGHILTGNYSNSFHTIDPQDGNNKQYEMNYASQTRMRQVGSNIKRNNLFNYQDKVLCHDYNPQTGQIAVATHNCFFIYSKDR